MACPHYLRAENRCQLLDSIASPSAEEEEELTPDEEVRLAQCRGPASAFSRCPVYRQYLEEERSAY